MVVGLGAAGAAVVGVVVWCGRRRKRGRRLFFAVADVVVGGGARATAARRVPGELRSAGAPVGRAVVLVVVLVDVERCPVNLAQVNKVTIKRASPFGAAAVGVDGGGEEREEREAGTTVVAGLDVGCCVNLRNTAGSVETSIEMARAVGGDGGVVCPCGLGRARAAAADKAAAGDALLGGVAAAAGALRREEEARPAAAGLNWGVGLVLVVSAAKAAKKSSSVPAGWPSQSSSASSSAEDEGDGVQSGE